MFYLLKLSCKRDMPAVSFVKLVKKLLHHLFLLYPTARVREVWFAYNCELCWCPFFNVMGQQTRSLGPMTKAHEGRRSLAYQLRRKSLLQKTGSVKGLRHNKKEKKRRPIRNVLPAGPRTGPKIQKVPDSYMAKCHPDSYIDSFFEVALLEPEVL